jgi:arylsulfatase A-like enzyme
MNFQTVSTAEKLPSSGGQPGGYLSDGVTPGPVLSGALDYIDSKVGAMVAALRARHLDGSTAIILSAKHGQSPDTPSALTRIPDGPIIDALNAAWQSAHPAAAAPLVAFSIDDDGMLIWLHDHSLAAADFARRFLLDHSGTGNDINGNPKPYTSSGLATVYAGRAAARYFNVGSGNERVPDVFGIAQYGSVYTGGHGKIAEHGGANPQDRDVPLVVWGGQIGKGGTVRSPVETTQIAPTILQLLGLRPDALQAVRIEHTQSLPLRDGGQDQGDRGHRGRP